jgi:hypothetical protein
VASTTIEKPSKFGYWRRYALVKILAGLILVCLIVGVFAGIAGASLCFGESIEWLKVGTWHHSTVAHEFYRSLPSSVQAWIKAPDSWLGVWKIVNEIGTWSAWWVFLLIAVPCMYWSLVLEDIYITLSRRLKEERTGEPQPVPLHQMSGPELIEALKVRMKNDQTP